MTSDLLSPENVADGQKGFSQIADTLRTQSWCVIPDALPAALAAALAAQVLAEASAQFSAAGIGRQQDHMLAPEVRSDTIQWISGITPAEQAWLQWADALRLFLNRRLFMGLDSFESHFAHYAPGAFYRKHRDAFRDAGSSVSDKRVLSVVVYLNADWAEEDGGELVVYDEAGEHSLQTVTPRSGTLAVFLSEDVPHEVRTSRRDRYSIAGWYRVRATAPPL